MPSPPTATPPGGTTTAPRTCPQRRHAGEARAGGPARHGEHDAVGEVRATAEAGAAAPPGHHGTATAPEQTTTPMTKAASGPPAATTTPTLGRPKGRPRGNYRARRGHQGLLPGRPGRPRAAEATAPKTPRGRCALQGSGPLNGRGTARRRLPSPGGSGDCGAEAFPTAARTSSTPTGHGTPTARFLHSRAKPAMGTTIAGSPRSPGTARKGATRRRVPAAADADDAEVEAPRPRTRGATSTPWT